MDDSIQAFVGRDKEGEKSKYDDETAMGTGGSREVIASEVIRRLDNLSAEQTWGVQQATPLIGRNEASSSGDIGLQDELGNRVEKTGKRKDDVGQLISSSTSNGKERWNEERYFLRRKIESNGKMRSVQLTSATRNLDCRRKYARHRNVN
ncbi:hypothetical protein Ancab_011139 [Ancistrocladus abbreviatus]